MHNPVHGPRFLISPAQTEQMTSAGVPLTSTGKVRFKSWPDILRSNSTIGLTGVASAVVTEELNAISFNEWRRKGGGRKLENAAVEVGKDDNRFANPLTIAGNQAGKRKTEYRPFQTFKPVVRFT